MILFGSSLLTITLLWSPSQAKSSFNEVNPVLNAQVGELLLPNTSPAPITIEVGESLAAKAEREAKEKAEAEKQLIASLYRNQKVTETEKQRNKEIAKALSDEFFGASQWPYFDDLINRESGYNHRVKNPSSGACGIPQALPCTKLAGFGDDSVMAVESQLLWMVIYVHERYDNPQGAIRWHNLHNWY